MKRYLIMLAATAAFVAILQGPGHAQSRLKSIESLGTADVDKIPPGAALWLHKKGKVWFHAPIDGHGYMKIDGKLWKSHRIKPAGNVWGCDSMVFKHPRKSLGGVRIDKQAAGWTIKGVMGLQIAEIKGLTCATGD